MAVSSRIIIFLFAIVICSYGLVLEQEEENLRSLMKLLSVPQKPERDIPKEYLKYTQPNVTTVTGYSWKSCGKASDPVTANVVLSPDPLPIPGNVTVTGNASLGVGVQSPVKLQLSIEKKVVVWITIPCIDNVGSCTYDDACLLLTQVFPDPACPPPLSTYSLPCHCPFKAGKYSLPASQIEINVGGIPTWLTSGDYYVKAVVSVASQELACYEVTLTLN